MMCESAGQGDARTGLFSATFTLSGQVNATLRASSHFFSKILGQFGLTGARERNGSKVDVKGCMKREVAV